VTIDCLLDAVAEGLAKGERVDFRGSALRCSRVRARSGRIHAPEKPSRLRPAGRHFFKVGKELRDRVNGERPVAQ